MSINSKNAKQSTQPIHDAPIIRLFHPKDKYEFDWVHTPQHFERFTRTDAGISSNCAIEKIYTDCGRCSWTQCYPVPDQGQTEVSFPVHPVLLHPCVFDSGEPFILLEILAQPTDEPDSWESSWNEALSTPIGQWLRISANYQQQRIEVTRVEAPTTPTTGFPQFLAVVLDIADASELSCLENRVKELINKKNRLNPSCLCPECGVPVTTE